MGVETGTPLVELSSSIRECPLRELPPIPCDDQLALNFFALKPVLKAFLFQTNANSCYTLKLSLSEDNSGSEGE